MNVFRPLDDETLARLRADTPGVGQRVHLNNAGAAMMPTPVLNTMTEHLVRESLIGGYEAQAEAQERVGNVYSSVAALVGAHPAEITVADSATLAWQRIFYSLPFLPGDRILTASTEFAANYIAYLQVSKRLDVSVEVIPEDSSGALDPAALEEMIDERVRLISIGWVPSNGGLINPAAAVGRIARGYGITYLLDACQAVGQLPIDVNWLGCDILTATGRKFLRRPRGTGFGYVRRELLPQLEPVFLDLFGAPMTPPSRYTLRQDARRFETWEVNYASRLGLGAAVDYALAVGIDKIRARNVLLTDRLREGLLTVEGLFLEDKDTDRAAIVSLTHRDVSATAMKSALADRRINASVSPPSTTPIDASARGLPDVLRLSPHYYNTEDEVDEAVAVLKEYLARPELRSGVV